MSVVQVCQVLIIRDQYLHLLAFLVYLTDFKLLDVCFCMELVVTLEGENRHLCKNEKKKKKKKTTQLESYAFNFSSLCFEEPILTCQLWVDSKLDSINGQQTSTR